MNVILLLLPIVIPMLAGIFLLITRTARSSRMAVLTTLVTGALLIGVPGRKAELAFSPDLTFLLEPDGFSLFFCVVIAVAFACATLYGGAYLAGDERRPNFFGFTLLTLGALMGLSLAGNIVTFYFFFECMSLLSFPLVLYNGGEKARSAAMCYLGFSVFDVDVPLPNIVTSISFSFFSYALRNGLTSEPNGVTVYIRYSDLNISKAIYD